MRFEIKLHIIIVLFRTMLKKNRALR